MHRQARGVLDPFFSKAKLTEMEHRVADRVQKLCDRFRCIRGTDTVVNITNAINSLTSGKKSSLELRGTPLNFGFRFCLFPDFRRPERLSRRC
jgi:hypothetical protein